MIKRLLRTFTATILAFALCAALVSPAVAVSGRVTFAGIDTLMIYNPEVDYEDYKYYSTMSTGNMNGQIKTADGNFNMFARPGTEETFYWDRGAELREEMNGFTPVISGPVNEAESMDRLMPDVAVGTKKTFFYWPDQGYDYAYETAEFTCVYVGENCLIWGYDFSDAAMAKEMGDEFDDLIYANNTAYFGTSRFMDQGEKINILVYSFYDRGESTNIIGFFWGIELYTVEELELWDYANYYNGGMPIIHINTDICTNEGNAFANYGAVTVAHEHQHLVNMSSTLLGNGYWSGISMGTWLNEAMAKEAEELSYPGMVVSNGYVSNCYNKSLDISGGQSLYNFTTYYDIGVYGQGFLFSEYIKQLNGGADVYKKIHDYWRTAPETELTDAAALYSALPESVRSEILGSVDYSAAVQDEFSGEEEEFLSKLALSFHVAAALKESSGIYGMPSTCSEASPLLFTDDQNLSWLDRFTRCDIECGGRIFVKTRDGNSYTVPSDADSGLIYVGFKNGEMVIAPTTAENYALSAYTVQAISNDTELGTVSLSGKEITAQPADGCGFAYPAYTVLSGSAEVVKNGTVFTVYPSSDCTVRINFEKRNDGLDLWDGSVAGSIPVSDGVYVVSTCAQLAKLAQMVNSGDNFSGKTVRLASDLDLNGLPWTPIGTSMSSSFRGAFEGSGYTVYNLAVTGKTYVGLFGCIPTGGTVSDLALKNAVVSGETYVGALAGHCYSAAVSGCTVSGTVTGTGNSVGLLCGSTAGGSVFRCGAEGSVNAPQKTGGLVGWVEDASVISECRSSASVVGKSEVGGLVGRAQENSSISNCYSRSAVSGTNGVGGIVGALNGVKLSNCYWSGEAARGGIAGDCSGTFSFSGCYYSSENCHYGANGDIPTGVIPLSEESMKQQSSYSNWDFRKIWKMAETANDGLPVLIWEEFAPALLSEGLTFDKSAVSDGCADLTVSFAGNGSRLLGLLGVDDEYVTVSRGSSGAPDTLTVSLYYLVTLPVGENTLYARYSNGFTVPFTVEVVDTSPSDYTFSIQTLGLAGANASVVFRLAAPEEKEVSLVFAAYMGGRMKGIDVQARTLNCGFNEVEFTLDIPWEDGMECAVFLMTEEGLVPLAEAYPFGITFNRSGSSMSLQYSVRQ